jgi:hypothetical protein
METFSGEPGAANSFRTPHAVSISKAQFKAGNDFRISLPKSSVSVMIFKLQ